MTIVLNFLPETRSAIVKYQELALDVTVEQDVIVKHSSIEVSPRLRRAKHRAHEDGQRDQH